MSQDEKKRRAARASLEYLGDESIVGIGTGSTVNFLIEEMGALKHRIEGAVASSEATESLLRQRGIPVVALNSVNDLSLYIDGADEATRHRSLIKGGGGALTREKIIAAASRRFVCIIDDSKLVPVLGRFPLPVEVIPMAQSYAAREIAKMGGQPRLRQDFITDNGNIILDVHNLSLADPVEVEGRLNQIAGVVCSGIFARRPADVLLVAGSADVECIE